MRMRLLLKVTVITDNAVEVHLGLRLTDRATDLLTKAS